MGWWQLRQPQLCLVTVSRAVGKVAGRLQSLQQASPGLSTAYGQGQPAPGVQGELVTMLPARPDVLLWMVGALSCLHPTLC